MIRYGYDDSIELAHGGSQHPSQSSRGGDDERLGGGGGGGYISPREYLVALYVIPLWLCLILVCLRGTSRWSNRGRQQGAARPSRQNSRGDGNPSAASQSEEDARRSGLNASTLNKIRQYAYHARSDSKGSSNDKYHDDCAVCMDQFVEGDVIRVLPMCGHTFHAECIDEWLALHPSCPICRKNTREALEMEEASGGEGAGPQGPSTSRRATEDVEQGEPAAAETSQVEGGGADGSGRRNGGEQVSRRPSRHFEDNISSWFGAASQFLRNSWNRQSGREVALTLYR